MHCFAGKSSFCQSHLHYTILDTYFNLLPIYHFYYSFVEISYQARFCLQISYPVIVFTMLMGFLYRGRFIVYVLLPGTSKAFTLSIFLAGRARSHCSPGHTTIYLVTGRRIWALSLILHLLRSWNNDEFLTSFGFYNLKIVKDINPCSYWPYTRCVICIWWYSINSFKLCFPSLCKS